MSASNQIILNKRKALSENECSAVRHAAKMLKSSFDVSDVILFGSKARGDDDEESDIDILLLINQSVSNTLRDNIVNALFDIELQYNVSLSPLIVSMEEWQEGPLSVLPIRDEIDKHGITI